MPGINSLTFYFDVEGKPAMKIIPVLDDSIEPIIIQAIREIRDMDGTIRALTPTRIEDLEYALHKGVFTRSEARALITRTTSDPHTVKIHDEEWNPHTLVVSSPELIQALKSAYQVYGRFITERLTARQFDYLVANGTLPAHTKPANFKTPTTHTRTLWNTAAQWVHEAPQEATALVALTEDQHTQPTTESEH